MSPNLIERNRAGYWISQSGGFSAFVPHPIPPDPPVEMTEERQALLSDADRALARLDGICYILPNPDLFVAMYMRKEAVLSSQIEGTQSSLLDVLDFEAGAPERVNDTAEVVNYIRAMNKGLDRLKELPLSLRLIQELHAELLKEVRGRHRTPGEFRREQNWIGPKGCSALEADFVPPPPNYIMELMGQLESFLHREDPIPPLIKGALLHAQFETIHPFLDGNGRLGRLLITFYLTWQGILEKPLLYLSYFLKRHRAEYYERLNAIRFKGEFEEWVDFFLKGIIEISAQATETARAILALQQDHRLLISAAGISSPLAMRLLDHLFSRPIITIKMVSKMLSTSFANANKLVTRFVDLGLLAEITGRRRNRRYTYDPYLTLLAEGTKE